MNLPLNKNNFSLLDRLRICQFVLNPKNRWTQGDQVKRFEQKLAEYVGCKYAVFVSSGSTANDLIAQYVKENCGERKIVVLPSTTWQTSCSPWIKHGFTPHFIDVSLEDFSFDKQSLVSYVEANHSKIACIFPTSLLGFVPDIEFYEKLQSSYGIQVAFDNCENTFGRFKGKNSSSYFTSSTSTYFGHQIQSIEGGFIFTNSLEEYEYYLVNRNHGMVRSLQFYGLDCSDRQNELVDPLFDFCSLGHNFRNTDLNAFIGLLDFNRAFVYEKSRKSFYDILEGQLDRSRFFLPKPRQYTDDCPFCFPIIFRDHDPHKVASAKSLCSKLGIEYRPIISGFLGYQTCYKDHFHSHDNYPNSIKLHKDGFYIGLYHNMNIKHAQQLISKLNQLK